jgi:hypothetical protein
MKPTIMIGLLGGGKHGKKMEGGLLESEMECPLETQDETVNKGNKQKAIIKAMYGPATDKNKKCGTCEYFDMSDAMKACGVKEGEGVCMVWEFKCREENTCQAWESGEEMESEESEEEGEDDAERE